MFLFKKELTGLEWTDSFMFLGIIVAAVSFSSFLVKFSKQNEAAAAEELSATRKQVEELELQPAYVKS